MGDPSIPHRRFQSSRPRRLLQQSLTLELTFIASARPGDACPGAFPLIAAAIWYWVITSLLMWIQSIIEALREGLPERRDNTGVRCARATPDEDKR